MQRRKILRLAHAILFTVLMTGLNAGGAEKPAILFLGKPGLYASVPYLDELEKHGFEVDAVGWGAVTPDFLRRYNAVIITGFVDESANVEGGGSSNESGFGPTRQRFVGDYMKAGGGVLLFLNTQGCYGKGKLGSVPSWLKKFDLDFYAETLEDPERSVRTEVPSLKRYGIKFAWTDSFAKHPVTDGVKNIWYPTGWGGHAAANTAPVTCGHQWEKLIFAGPSAKIAAPHNDLWEDIYRKDPPAGPYSLLAVRKANLGRLAVIGVHPMWTVWSPYAEALGPVVMKNGEQGRPSDFAKLFENLYRWLAEPSMQMGIYGTEVAKRPPLPGDTPPIPWGGLTFPQTADSAAPRKYYRGHVGAHTSLSTGKGSVKDWADAAKKAGFSFIIFTEDLAAMDEAKWKQLQKECQAATSADFIAYPGFEYRNAAGTRGFMPIGYKDWMPKTWLTDDGKRINIDRGWSPAKGWDAKTGHQSGQIMAFLTWFCNGYFDFEKNPTPFWDYKLYSLFPVWSSERGRPLDNALDKFLHANTLGVNPAAYSLDLIYDPAELATAIPQGRPHLVISAAANPCIPDDPSLSNIFNRQAVSNTPDGMSAGGYRGWIGPVATQGPALRMLFRGGYQWEGVELPRYWIERHAAPQEKDWYMPSWYRLKLRIEADSDAGLKDITIYDGEKVFRRFDAAGAKQFSTEFSVTQCPTRHLVAVATDVNGRQAVSREIWMEQQTMLYNYCGDRVNAPGSIFAPIHGHPYLDKGSKQYEVRRFSLDGVSPDLYIERYTTDWIYDRNELSDEFGWHNWAPHHPREDLTFTQTAAGWYQGHGRKISYDKHPSQGIYWDGFTPVEIVDADKLPKAQLKVFTQEMKLKKAAEPDADGFINRSVMVWEIPMPKDQPGYIAIIPPEGAVEEKKLPDGGAAVKGLLPEDAVVTVAPAAGQAKGYSVLATGANLAYWVARSNDKAILKIGVAGEQAGNVGTAFKWRLEEINRAVTAEMLRKPQIQVEVGKASKGLSLCEQHLSAKDGVAVVELLAAAVPETNCIPLVVEGVNSNWTAACYEKASGLYRPVGSWDGKAFVQFPAGKAGETVVVGNIVRADNPEVRIDVIQDTDDAGAATGRWLVDAHNPTDKPLNVRFSVPREFELIKKRDHEAMIPAGASISFSMD